MMMVIRGSVIFVVSVRRLARIIVRMVIQINDKFRRGTFRMSVIVVYRNHHRPASHQGEEPDAKRHKDTQAYHRQATPRSTRAPPSGNRKMMASI